ncbi:DUF2043 domain-containing protein (plasmid) [Haloplanus rubicundus]|uniref:DUF2043 domain-containing protein n=1 Tax=Haloplanus rubicundus TaxID=1547898 RepID=A0A345EID4_9EURY|nr:DUF2043 domain-containing protein [Haloplanus rubicundus]
MPAGRVSGRGYAGLHERHASPGRLRSSPGVHRRSNPPDASRHQQVSDRCVPIPVRRCEQTLPSSAECSRRGWNRCPLHANQLVRDHLLSAARSLSRPLSALEQDSHQHWSPL